MTLILSVLAQILHMGLVLGMAPLVAGITAWLDARLEGQPGPPILLPWHELIRLFRKTPMLLDDVSGFSRVAPAVVLATTFSVAALVPSFTMGMAFSPLSDILLIVSLLAGARAVSALAAFDSGSALPGLTQQRASARAMLTEGAVMLVFVALAMMAGTLNLDLMIVHQSSGAMPPTVAVLVSMIALLALFMTEESAPAADEMFGGVDLAMLRLARWLRRIVWIGLIADLFLPAEMASLDSGTVAWTIGFGAWVLKLGLIVLASSVFRWLLGVIPPRHVNLVNGVATFLAFLAILMALANAGTT